MDGSEKISISLAFSKMVLDDVEVEILLISWRRGKNGLFKVQNRLVIKNQEVRGQVSTTFSEAPNSGLTVSGNIFVVARLKLVLFQF